MKLIIDKTNVTRLVSKLTVSGSSKECARTLSAEILQSPYDTYIPFVEVEKGMTTMFEHDNLTHMGVIFDVTRSTNSNTISIKAFDLGIYIKRNQITQKVRGQAPENVARNIIGDLGFTCGHLEKTGFKFSRKFFGATAYDAIMTGYTLASRETGEKYILRVRDTSICIERRGAYVAAFIKPRGNMIYATYSENINNAINRVEVYSNSGSYMYSLTGDTSYGTLCRILSDSDTARDDAKEILEDYKAERTATVQILGHSECITGNAVVVKEPYTNLYGLFFIDDDIHTFENGVYTTKLSLAFENLMDEREAGEKLSASSGSTPSDSSFDADEDLIYHDVEGNEYAW